MATDTAFGEVRFFDDFLGDTVDTNSWTINNDSGTDPAIVEAVANGNCNFTGTTNGHLQSIFGVDQFIPSTQGTIVFEARLKLVTSTTQGVFVGLTDDNATDENPIDLDTGTLTTTAVNAIGFVYDSQEGTNWYCCSVNNNTDGAQTASGSGPTVDTYQTLRIVVESNGNARYFIDGKEVTASGAARTAAVVTTTPLAAAVTQLLSGTAANVYLDYVYVSAGRA